MKSKLESVEDFYAFKFGAMWRYCKTQHFSFWMICSYLVIEFVRPQTIIPAIDFLPWAQLFVVGAIIGIFTDSSVKWLSCSANKWIILFLITILISIVFAKYPDISKKYFMVFFSWFIVYFLIINIVNTKERFYVFLMLYFVAAAKIAVGTSKSWAFRGFSFTSWGLSGPKGYFQNSGELAILMLMIFPLAFYLYQGLKGKVKTYERWLLILCWVCPILTILGASSRGAQIALVLELLVMFRKSIASPKLLIGVVVLSMSVFYLLPDQQKERFSKTGDDKTSQQRILYWGHGWDMMKDNPFTGVGFFNFVPYYEDNFRSDMLYPHAELPHNIFVQVGTDAGFIALFAFIMLIFYCIHTCYKISKRKTHEPGSPWPYIAAGLGVGVFGFLIAGQFVTVGYYPFLWIHLAMIACLERTTKLEKS